MGGARPHGNKKVVRVCGVDGDEEKKMVGGGGGATTISCNNLYRGHDFFQGKGWQVIPR